MTRRSVCHRVALLAASTVAALLAVATPVRGQSLETLVNFDCDTVGCAPNGVFLQARDSFFYGTTSENNTGGGEGTVFRMDRSGSITVLSMPARGFFEASDGFFYGTSQGDGEFGFGTVFRMDSNGAIAVIHSFDGVHASNPGPLVEAEDGWFYGIVGIPDTDDVRLFRINAQGALKLLRPLGPEVRGVRTLIQGDKPFFYGTTYSGCDTGAGCVFRTHRNGQTRVLLSLESAPGAGSSSGYGDLMMASDGSFYGTTIEGGAHGAGKIFRMSKSGKVRVLHSFDGGAGGANPYVAPIEGMDGYFYGSTGFGGRYDEGTVYRMDRSGRVTILHSFGESPEAGRSPIAPLVQADDGALYGVTVFGGTKNQGTAFRLSLKH